MRVSSFCHVLKYCVMLLARKCHGNKRMYNMQFIVISMKYSIDAPVHTFGPISSVLPVRQFLK